jgi:mono/diheme cytochrome c family protein
MKVCFVKPSRVPARYWSLVVVSLFVACQKAPADLREWTPKDHTNQSNQVAAGNGQVAASPPPVETPPPGLDAVTLAAWGANCALCHGKVGRGDGPQGPMLKAPDLSNPEWQLQVSDSQIRQTITAGKKAMPAFAHLPATTLDGLTLLVRWFNRDQAALKKRMSASAAASAGAATTPSETSDAPTGMSHSPATGPVRNAVTASPPQPSSAPKTQANPASSTQTENSTPVPP